MSKSNSYNIYSLTGTAYYLLLSESESAIAIIIVIIGKQRAGIKPSRLTANGLTDHSRRWPTNRDLWIGVWVYPILVEY